MADGPSLDCRIEDVRGYNTLEDLTQPNSLTSKGGGYSDDKGGCESYQLPGQPRPIILDPIADGILRGQREHANHT